MSPHVFPSKILKLLKGEIGLLEDTGTDPDGTGDNVIVVPPVVLVTFVPELNGSDAELPIVNPAEEEADGVEPMPPVITLDIRDEYPLAPTDDELMVEPVTGEDKTALDESESLVVAELVVPETVKVSVPEGTTDVVDTLPPVAKFDVSGEPLPVFDDDELMFVFVTGDDETKLEEDETMTVTEPIVREKTVGNDVEGDLDGIEPEEEVLVKDENGDELAPKLVGRVEPLIDEPDPDAWEYRT
ncbi:hypothetical protein LTR28_011451 [Elasticomyces elasticus]|nr:hypothetical protein LTR28_011451 [Elasticomyces elasticus]